MLAAAAAAAAHEAIPSTKMLCVLVLIECPSATRLLLYKVLTNFSQSKIQNSLNLGVTRSRSIDLF